MGFKLRREVRDLIPPGLLTARERGLVLELADWCSDETRSGWPGVDWLAEKADIPEAKRVGEHFASVAKKWVELRVPLGKSDSGRVYYSQPGQRTAYQFPTREELMTIFAAKIPHFPGSKVPENPGSKIPRKGVPKVPENPGTRSRENRDPSPWVSPQEDPSSLSSGLPVAEDPPADDRERDEDVSEPKPQPLDSRYRYVAELGVTDPDEARQVIDEIERANQVKRRGFWPHVAGNGTLVDLIADARQRLAALDRLDVEPQPVMVVPTVSRTAGWCGRCSDPLSRLVTVPGTGREEPCPACNPRSSGYAGRTAA